MTMTNVLVANRGEIAVRVIRAARDAGLRSVAVYADPTPTRCSSNATRLSRSTATRPDHLDIAKIPPWPNAGADAAHPGYVPARTPASSP